MWYRLPHVFAYILQLSFTVIPELEELQSDNTYAGVCERTNTELINLCVCVCVCVCVNKNTFLLA